MVTVAIMVAIMVTVIIAIMVASVVAIRAGAVAVTPREIQPTIGHFGHGILYEVKGLVTVVHTQASSLRSSGISRHLQLEVDFFLVILSLRDAASDSGLEVVHDIFVVRSASSFKVGVATQPVHHLDNAGSDSIFGNIGHKVFDSPCSLFLREQSELS
jgi:hypothetical protein